MAAKKKKIDKIDPRVEILRILREQAAQLKKVSDDLKDELFEEYGLGAHPGFTFFTRPTQRLDSELLEAKLGKLDAYKTTSDALHIEFIKHD